ncbi:hypothetical protein Glove_267g68 [Diversispora epigaea]|uniref:Uncharacterized protein n=1 Tax=Diversispora epigaea TaxID=1348612 RepID=A0A397IBN4_9GLOM|nr:hypothetical protein Glove_267g68 [Diversispora epigaea]
MISIEKLRDLASKFSKINQLDIIWDAQITHRPTFKELDKYLNYRENNQNNNNEITILIKEAKEFSKNQNNN